MFTIFSPSVANPEAAPVHHPTTADVAATRFLCQRHSHAPVLVPATLTATTNHSVCLLLIFIHAAPIPTPSLTQCLLLSSNIEGSCRSWKKIVKSLDDGSVKGRFGRFGCVTRAKTV